MLAILSSECPYTEGFDTSFTMEQQVVAKSTCTSDSTAILALVRHKS
jgi:hypothetical protein